MGAQFTPGRFELRIVNPECRIMVDGWTDGTFGIDRRVRTGDDFRMGIAHVITQLRIGGAVRYVKGSLANAKKIAAILHEAPWDFDDPTDCKKDGRLEAVKKAMATGLCIPSWEVTLPEEVLERIAKPRGETA